jgi:tetratricopeptide (TPR) repeat protein
MRRTLSICALALLSSAPLFAQQKDEPLEGVTADQYVRTWPALKDCAAQAATDRQAALRCADERIRTGTAAAGAGNLKAQLLREQGDLAGATAAIEPAIQLEPNQDLHYFQNGQIILTKVKQTSNPLSQWRMASAADGAFEKAFEINPRGYFYRRHIAVAKLNKPAIAGGDKNGALALANEGIGMGINECYMLRGYANIIFNKPAEAFVDYDKAISLGVYDNTLFIRAARTAVDAKDFTHAERYFQYVAEKRPATARSHFLLGDYYAGRGDTARAVAALEAALRIDPNYRAAADQLARLRTQAR